MQQFVVSCPVPTYSFKTDDLDTPVVAVVLQLHLNVATKAVSHDVNTTSACSALSNRGTDGRVGRF